MFSPRNLILSLLSSLFGCVLLAADFERDPIRYSDATPQNPITRLQERLEQGKAKLEFEEHFGYLRSVLKELQVPLSSQTLVFSKTSLQRNRISPRMPRSLYFSDDMYIGFCQRGDVVEISAVDPQLGAVFYTLDQVETNQPKFVRHTDNCLLCHGSSHTEGVPGHMIRSVYPDSSGMPIFSAGTVRVDHTTPITKRWGGWYVSGKHGKQSHVGNLIVRGEVKEPMDNTSGENVTDLSSYFRVENFLTPHSDLVALMVLEHQATAHNLITRANFACREALYYEAALNRETKQTADHRWDSTNSRIKSAGEPLVKYLLFANEAPLTSPITGTADFAAEFVRSGPRDKQNRSLREFDLTNRIFKYPCSYLIYSEAFDALPGEMKNYVYRRMHEVLTGKDQSPGFGNLSAADRKAILEILRDTKTDLPKEWRS